MYLIGTVVLWQHGLGLEGKMKKSDLISEIRRMQEEEFGHCSKIEDLQKLEVHELLIMYEECRSWFGG